MKRGKFGIARCLIWRGLAGGLTMVLCAIAALPVLASGGGNKGAAEGINYIPITPPLVVNYGGPGKSRYIKAELSIRSENAADANTVTHNLPLIRDRLVSILSAQTEEIVSSAEGKEYLRIYALAEINKALLQVQGLATPPTANITAEAPATPASVAAPSQTSLSAASTTSAPATASLPVVTPVKGPASDLYFNNFVVQK
jgi:flagellar FliL protein